MWKVIANTVRSETYSSGRTDRRTDLTNNSYLHGHTPHPASDCSFPECGLDTQCVPLWPWPAVDEQVESTNSRFHRPLLSDSRVCVCVCVCEGVVTFSLAFSLEGASIQLSSSKVST